MSKIDEDKLRRVIEKSEKMLVPLRELFTSDHEEQTKLDLIEDYITKIKAKLSELSGSSSSPSASTPKTEGLAKSSSAGVSGISASVGRGGTNNEADVRVVQKLLRITVDGQVGPKTIGAIETVQRSIFNGWSDGLVEPGGRTWRHISQGNAGEERPAPTRNDATTPDGAGEVDASESTGGYFSHPRANQVSLTYGDNAVRLNSTAAHLLKSILAACDIFSAHLTSTLRTYHDQARICLEQVDQATTLKWYGGKVAEARIRFAGNIQGFADWWEAYDQKRSRVSSRHLSNQAMDVVPSERRQEFAEKVEFLVPVSGSGVRRIIPKGTMNEPVDHVEFTFKVTG